MFLPETVNLRISANALKSSVCMSEPVGVSEFAYLNLERILVEAVPERSGFAMPSVCRDLKERVASRGHAGRAATKTRGHKVESRSNF